MTRTYLMLRAQSIALVVALIVLAGLAAWASFTWQTSADWTYGQRASLTPASRTLLATLDKPVTITAFVRPGTQIAQYEKQLLARYRRADASIALRFVNPDTALATLRKLGIRTAGELYVRYGERGTKLDDISEAGITNALLRLARGGDKRVVFITGHGEASPTGKRNYDLSQFASALKRQGFNIVTRNLAHGFESRSRPSLVVIAGPQTTFAPSEVTILKVWLAGGNLLWLKNPGPVHGLAPLAQALGIEALSGTVVSTASRGFGINDPSALLVSHYGDSAITRGFDLNTLFPDATGFKIVHDAGWTSQVFIQSPDFPTSWLMHGGLVEGHALYRPEQDTPGPIPIAIAFTRKSGAQRAAVVGDVSFLANRFLGNGGNLNLGLKLVNWLTGEDRFIAITPVQAPDEALRLSTAEQAGIGFGFLAFLPGLFLVIAIVLAWIRRRS